MDARRLCWVNALFRVFLKIVEIDENEFLLEYLVEGKVERELYCGRIWRIVNKSGTNYG